jgi:antitoxin component YwqK of YwqJK toxin-antitoxin module
VVILGDIVEYGHYVKVLGKLLEPIDSMAKVSLYKEEQKVLQEFVHNKAEQKTEYYDKKIAEMKQKYDMDFSAFQKKIYLSPEEVNFEEWDDFVLWGSYVKAYLYWAQFC